MELIKKNAENIACMLMTDFKDLIETSKDYLIKNGEIKNVLTKTKNNYTIISKIIQPLINNFEKDLKKLNLENTYKFKLNNFEDLSDYATDNLKYILELKTFNLDFLIINFEIKQTSIDKLYIKIDYVDTRKPHAYYILNSGVATIEVNLEINK